MALSAATLEAAIVAALAAKMAIDFPQSAAGLAGYHAAIANGVAAAVVAHLTSAGAVSVTGVTACPAGAGTLTGSGTVA